MAYYIEYNSIDFTRSIKEIYMNLINTFKSILKPMSFILTSNYIVDKNRSKNVKITYKNQIKYYPNLVKELISENNENIIIFTSIIKAAKNRNYEKVSVLLRFFQNKVNSHLLKENIKFYIYTRNALKNDPLSLNLMRYFKAKSLIVSKNISLFIETYVDCIWTNVTIKLFEKSIIDILDSLNLMRYEKERKLYPLYLHPDDYF